MHKLISHVLPRLTAIALTFAVALVATFVGRILPVFQLPPDSPPELFGVLTPAVIGEPMWPVGLVSSKGQFWIFRRQASAAELDINQPVPLPTPSANSISTGCQTLAVTIDTARKLHLNNTDYVGSLDDPSALAVRLIEIFREREINRAYKPGMEYGSEIPSNERIEKTVVILPSASLTYAEVIELLSIIERTGANPVVLQVGEPTQSFQAIFTQPIFYETSNSF